MHLVTQRLTIRPLRPADEADFCAELSDPALATRLVASAGADGQMRLICDLDRAEMARMFAARLAERIAGAVSRYAITRRDSERLVGSTGSYAIDDETVGLSYWVASHQQGQGYGTEALRAYCHPALQLFGRRVMLANVALDNAASLRVVEKAGFRVSATAAPGGPGRVFLSIDLDAAAVAGKE